MVKIGGILGGAAGFVFGGFIGALVGYGIGSMISNSTVSVNGKTAGTKRATSTDFAVSLMVLIAAVMKADGKVLRSELDFVKRYLNQAYGPQTAQELTVLLRDILKKEIRVPEVCMQMKTNMGYSTRLELIHFLYKLALADGSIHPNEKSIIDQICSYLGISSSDSRSIQAMFYDNVESAYEVLETTQNATDEEIRKAYKKMAVKYHPDKVSHLGEEVQKSATEKFKKVNEAYERIKKQRNIK